MRVIIISRDKTVKDVGSPAYLRMQDYKKLADEFAVIAVGLFELLFLPIRRLRFKPDLITSQDPFETGLASFLLSKRTKSCLQLQIHTDFLDPLFLKGSWKNFIRVALAKFLLPRADCVRVVSKRIKDSINKKGLRLKCEPDILPIFVDVKKYAEGLASFDLHKNYPQFEKIILMASRLSREKNIGVALAALQKVMKSNPRVGLVIVGEGPCDKELRKVAKNLGIEKKVIFESWNNDLVSYYKTADVFLLTSDYEGYGMAIVEAIASGIPVVATDAGVVSEPPFSSACLVASAGDVEKISELLLEVLSNTETRNNLVEIGRKIINEMPNKEEYLKKYKENWDSCSNSCRKFYR